ncbi:MAG TPA: peptidoglycan DD-metalloendopeptidase family protein, partial [Acidimicrobiia bacterium]|nr:peptidoglycan DD-metalloendopeptidase family protein [Acidimicrobiia bacterium]
LFAATPAALGAKRARPPKGGDLERKRDEAKRKEEQVRHDLDLAQASETELEKHLAAIAADLVDRQADAADARSDADQATASVTKITADIVALKVELVHRKDIFNRRAVMAYMGGGGRPLDDLALAGELLSVPSDLTDAARRTQIMRGVSEQDNDAYTKLIETQDKLAHDELALTAARDRERQRAADAQVAVKAVAQLKKDQEAAKAVLDQRIAELTSEADALAAEQSQLQTLILQRQAALEAARKVRAAAGNGLSRLPTGGSGISPSGFIWPVQGVLTSGYGPRWGRMHTGIDIAAPAGTPIHAAKAGEVIYAGWLNGYGNTVVLDHGDGIATLYGHQSRIGSTEGQTLNQGDVLGFVGSTGHSTGNHLHFEVRIDAQPRNPRPYLP